MPSNPHREQPLRELGVAPDVAERIVVAVHGRGQSPEFIVEHLVDPLDDGRTAWLLPAAAGGSWYPLGFMADVADNQPWLDDALEVLDVLAARCEAEAPSTPIVWAGFSQGACLVTEWVARHPRRWGALLSLTGGRIGGPGTDLSIAAGDGFEGLPAYFGVGDADEWVPVERVKATVEAYRAAGAEVTLDVMVGRPHEISSRELDRARAVLHAVRRAAAS